MLHSMYLGSQNSELVLMSKRRSNNVVGFQYGDARVAMFVVPLRNNV